MVFRFHTLKKSANILEEIKVVEKVTMPTRNTATGRDEQTAAASFPTETSEAGQEAHAYS